MLAGAGYLRREWWRVAVDEVPDAPRDGADLAAPEGSHALRWCRRGVPARGGGRVERVDAVVAEYPVGGLPVTGDQVVYDVRRFTAGSVRHPGHLPGAVWIAAVGAPITFRECVAWSHSAGAATVITSPSQYWRYFAPELLTHMT